MESQRLSDPKRSSQPSLHAAHHTPKKNVPAGIQTGTEIQEKEERRMKRDERKKTSFGETRLLQPVEHYDLDCFRDLMFLMCKGRK